MGVDTTRRAWFEMDYVPARTLGDLVRTQTPFDAQRIMAAIANILALFRATESATLPAVLFHTKIAGNRDGCRGQAPQLRNTFPNSAALRRRSTQWIGLAFPLR